MVRTAATRFLVIKLSFNHDHGNRLVQQLLAVPYEFKYNYQVEIYHK